MGRPICGHLVRLGITYVYCGSNLIQGNHYIVQLIVDDSMLESI